LSALRTVETALPGVRIVERASWDDERGFLVETFDAARYSAAGIAGPFVLGLHTRSKRGTLRGLHFQQPHPQGKLVEVVRGEIFDVVVDVRRRSPDFGRWISVTLSDDNHRQLWIPPGFAHGFCAVSDMADVVYKVDAPFVAGAARHVAWNDRSLAIAWPVADPVMSAKDRSALPLAEQPDLPER
jgi:dTDP-4-dehydrorhamnose 3,5-epimerase